MGNVAIVGIGIHPFGRHPGLTGRQQGAYAIREALADAGISWPDVQCAFGGSAAAGNPDTLVGDQGAGQANFDNPLYRSPPSRVEDANRMCFPIHQNDRQTIRRLDREQNTWDFRD